MAKSSKKRRRRTSAIKQEVKKKTSPLKGRTIDKSKRNEDAPKLGRRFKFGGEAEKINMTLSLPPGLFQRFQDRIGSKSRAGAVTDLILRFMRGDEDLD